MTGRRRFGAFAAMALAWAVAVPDPARSQAVDKREGAAAEFMIGAQAFRMRLPEGYCLASDHDLREMRTLDPADPFGDTLVLVNRCAERAPTRTHYAVLKSARHYVDSNYSLEQVLSSFPTASDLAEDRAVADQAKELGRQISEIRREKTEIQMAIKPRGRDDRCGYIGGGVSAVTAEGTYHRAAGTCVTVVAGKVMVIVAFGPPGGEEAVEPLLQLVKTFATGIQPAAN